MVEYVGFPLACMVKANGWERARVSVGPAKTLAITSCSFQRTLSGAAEPSSVARGVVYLGRLMYQSTASATASSALR